jgi:hypothetical protein
MTVGSVWEASEVEENCHRREIMARIVMTIVTSCQAFLSQNPSERRAKGEFSQSIFRFNRLTMFTKWL